MSQDKKNIGSVIVVCIQFSKLVSKIEQVGDCMEKKENGTALLPIVVFLVIYLGNGVYFEYVRPVDGEMGFYIGSGRICDCSDCCVVTKQNGFF